MQQTVLFDPFFVVVVAASAFAIAAAHWFLAKIQKKQKNNQ